MWPNLKLRRRNRQIHRRKDRGAALGKTHAALIVEMKLRSNVYNIHPNCYYNFEYSKLPSKSNNLCCLLYCYVVFVMLCQNTRAIDGLVRRWHSYYVCIFSFFDAENVLVQMNKKEKQKASNPEWSAYRNQLQISESLFGSLISDIHMLTSYLHHEKCRNNEEAGLFPHFLFAVPRIIFVQFKFWERFRNRLWPLVIKGVMASWLGLCCWN